MAGKVSYWLLKTEPDCFSIADLKAQPKQTTYWDGVRNYQARNMLRDDIKEGDRVLFYHSNAKPPGVAGTAIVVKAGYPDFTAFDPSDHHYDPKSRADEPTWYMVDIKFESAFAELVSLDDMKAVKSLAEMEVLRRGSRLSVQPVRKHEFETVLKLAEQKQKI
jgi:predicted RNA-binding protein with PUA-like domain